MSYHQDGAGQLSESEEASPRRQRGETSEGRTSQHHTALDPGSDLHRDPSDNIKISSITGHPKSTSWTTEKTSPQEPIISQVTLGLQIRLSGRMGGLGISIAGGKGSLPFKDHDEGIFISRVIRGGSSEKAGIHVGDRLLEVNGLSLQGATHQEAVIALRRAGGCITLKVLRERARPREACDLEGPPGQQDMTEQQLCVREGGGQGGKRPTMESAEDCLSRKTEAVVCNGNSDLESELQAEDLVKNDSLHGRKHTMAIPRIILTHPSTSDEDVELLTRSPSGESQQDFDVHDRHVCFDGSFYPP